MRTGLLCGTTLALLAQNATAQDTPAQSCNYVATRIIAFETNQKTDRLTVSIGPGPCHSAEFSLSISSSRSKVLYRYAAPLKGHLAISWDDPELPAFARSFAKRTFEEAVVTPINAPELKEPGQGSDGEMELAVPTKVFKRLKAAQQPLVYHQTYYEGGQYIAFDPVARKSVVIARWGL